MSRKAAVLDRKVVKVPTEIRQEVEDLGFRGDEDDYTPDSDVPTHGALELLNIEDAAEFPLYRGQCLACGHEALAELESEECPLCLAKTMYWDSAS